mmetsp:Transcript_75975/g.197688  ORF Transcript_75975/g.197688 Transcript_75975/m.197688 type:complete len:234 (-) Transcript_75975:569-1270(-)
MGVERKLLHQVSIAEWPRRMSPVAADIPSLQHHELHARHAPLDQLEQQTNQWFLLKADLLRGPYNSTVWQVEQRRCHHAFKAGHFSPHELLHSYIRTEVSGVEHVHAAAQFAVRVPPYVNNANVLGIAANLENERLARLFNVNLVVMGGHDHRRQLAELLMFANEFRRLAVDLDVQVCHWQESIDTALHHLYLLPKGGDGVTRGTHNRLAKRRELCHVVEQESAEDNLAAANA